GRDGAFAQGQALVRHHHRLIEIILYPQSVAFRTGAMRIVDENSRGSISEMVKPDTGQANLEEKTICFCLPSFSFSSANSTTSRPSASLSAVSIESGRRLPISGLTTIRSTTISISCLSFLSKAGVAPMS